MIQRGKVGTDMTRIPSMGEEGKTIKAGITVKINPHGICGMKL